MQNGWRGAGDDIAEVHEGTFESTGLWRRTLTQAQLWLQAQCSSLCPTLKGTIHQAACVGDH